MDYLTPERKNSEEFDNTPQFEVESINSNEDFDLEVEIDNEIENEIQNHLIKKNNETCENIQCDNEFDSDFFNFMDHTVEDSKKRKVENTSSFYSSYCTKPKNDSNYYFLCNQNTNYSTNMFTRTDLKKKVYTEEEKNEIFNKVDLKNTLEADSEEVFNIYLDNYTLKRNVLNEIDLINNNDGNKELGELIMDIDNFQFDDFLPKKSSSYDFFYRRDKKDEKEKTSNLRPIYNFFTNSQQEKKELKKTHFDFFREYVNDNDDEDDENNELQNPYEDSISIYSKNNQELTNYVDDSDNDIDDNKESSMNNNNNQGEFSKIFNKTNEYFDKNCFSDDEVMKNYDEVYDNCKPYQRFYHVIKRCIENQYFDKYFFEYFGKTFFENVYKPSDRPKQDDESESDLYDLDEDIFNICLMNLVTKNIKSDYILTREFFKCYAFIYSFIEDVICHYYFNKENHIEYAATKSYQQINKLIPESKRMEYLTTKPIPNKYLICLSMWLFALSLKDIYPTKEAIIMNIYYIDYIFKDVNIQQDYDSEFESDFEDNNSTNSIPEPDFEELEMVNNNYNIEYDSFTL